MARYFTVLELEDGAELFSSMEDAICKAMGLVEGDSKPRHVVKIMSRVETEISPIRVTDVFREEEEESDDQEEPHSSSEEA